MHVPQKTDGPSNSEITRVVHSFTGGNIERIKISAITFTPGWDFLTPSSQRLGSVPLIWPKSDGIVHTYITIATTSKPAPPKHYEAK